MAEAKILLKYSANKNVYDDYGKKPMYVSINYFIINIIIYYK